MLPDAEYGWIIFSVTICIFIVPIAIGAACCLIVAAGFGFKHWLEKRRHEKMDQVSSNNDDEEQGKRIDNEQGRNEKGTAKSDKKKASKEDLHQPLLAS